MAPMDPGMHQDGPVVVGVESEASSLAALQWAAAEATRRGVALRIVNAWSIPVAGWADLGAWPVLEASLFADVASQIVADASARVLADLGQQVPVIETAIPEGPAALALLAAAEDASLLVVGSHGSGVLAGMRVGSVAAACAHRSRVPVAVIPPDHDGANATGPIVVGVDDSLGARRALRVAAQIAAGRTAAGERARLVVVHGWDRFAWAGPDGTMPEPAGDVEARLTAERLLLALVEDVTGDVGEGVDVIARAVGAPGARALLDEADGASLLVVGSRGRGGFARLLLGSISTQCLHHALCPVLIVPGPRSDE